MEKLNEVVAKNLIKFRSIAGFTQIELSKKINYSDKTISKWEKGESLPDLAVLVKLSEIYKININDFLDDKTDEQKSIISKKIINKKHLLVALLIFGLILFFAAVTFFVLFMIESTQNIAYLSFIYSIPICATTFLIFSLCWWNNYTNTIFSSAILWGIILSVFLTFKISKIWTLCIVGLVLEIIIIIFFILLTETKKRKNNK